MGLDPIPALLLSLKVAQNLFPGPTPDSPYILRRCFEFACDFGNDVAGNPLSLPSDFLIHERHPHHVSIPFG